VAPGAVAAMVGAVIRDVTRRLRRIDERIELELRSTPRGRSAAPAPAGGPEPARAAREVTLEDGAARANGEAQRRRGP
jgi:hypothetical protein